MNRRTLSADELMPEYTELLAAGAKLPLVVSGASMLPFLYPGRDTVILDKADTAAKRGDVLLYCRTNGRYILHRVRGVDGEGLWFAGDAQDELEGPISPEQVKAKVTEVLRKGKTVKKGSILWWFYEKPWSLTFGHRKKLLALASRIRKRLGRKE